MLANDNSADTVRAAYPVLTEDQVEAASLYARANPRRGRPRREPDRRSGTPAASSALDLGGTSSTR